MSSLRPSPLFRAANHLSVLLLRLGLPIGARRSPMYLLTVPGRRSGRLRTTPVALTPSDGGWILASVYGVADWARNLEAAGEAEIRRGRRTIHVSAHRLPDTEAGPILRDGIRAAPRMVQRMTAPHFSARTDSPMAAWVEEAAGHPVFLLSAREEAQV